MAWWNNMTYGDIAKVGGPTLAAPVGMAGYQSMQDINAINRMAASGNYGVGNRMPQAFMDKLKGAYTPSSVFKKTGYPTGLKNWFTSRSSPQHFGPVESVMKAGSKLKNLAGGMGGASRFGLGALRGAMSTPALGVYGTAKMAEAQGDEMMNATRIAEEADLNLEDYITRDGTRISIDPNFYEAAGLNTSISGDEIQKQVTETETIDPYGNDPYGTEHHYVTPDKKRSLPTFGLSGIFQGLKNQFKKNPEKQKEFDSWEENKNQKGWGYIGDTGLRGNIYEGSGGKKFSLFDPTTGYNVLQNKNWRGGTGNSLREQINLKNAWIADRLFRGKRLGKKADAYAKLNKLGTYADQETFTPPPGGGPLNEPGGEWVGGAPAYTHQGIGGGEYTNEIGNVEYQDPYDPGGGEAAGGLMRIHSRGRYSKGGRVGILSVF